MGEQIYQPPTKLLENSEPDSADISAFALSAEQTSVSLYELYLSLNELSKYKIYVNETYVQIFYFIQITNEIHFSAIDQTLKSINILSISVLPLKNGYQLLEINFFIVLNMHLIKIKWIQHYQHQLVINLHHHQSILPVVFHKSYNFGND